MKQQDLSRETFAALRARHEAYRVASDILYEEPIDVRTVACSGCGGWIDVHGGTVTDPIRCPACGTRMPLPPHIRAKYMPRQFAPSASLEYRPCDERLVGPQMRVRRLSELEVPLWLVWTTVILFTALFVSVAMVLANAGLLRGT